MLVAAFSVVSLVVDAAFSLLNTSSASFGSIWMLEILLLGAGEAAREDIADLPW